MDQRELAIITRLLGSDIKKPTALVHFQRQMSQVAQRIMTLLIFNAQETEGDAKGHYEVRVKFVHDFLGWTESKNYERIYEAFREIKGNDIVWNFLGEDRTLDELRCSFLITLGISRRSGLIRYKFHPELLPIIRNPSVFAKLKLIMLAVLAHPKYAYPLYEFIADSFCRGKPAERISLVKLKGYLGIPPTSYIDYVTFKEQVLQPSLKAINRISDYAVTYTTYREGRRVAGMVLHIERKSHWQQPLLLEKPLAVMQRYFGVEPIAPVSAEEDAAVSAFVASVRRYGIDNRTARAFELADQSETAVHVMAEQIASVFGELMRKAGHNALSGNMGALLIPCISTLLRRPGSTIRDLQTFMDDKRNRELWEVGCRSAVQAHRDFFHERFYEKQFESTKAALYTRIQSLLNSPVLYRLLVGPSTVNLEEAVNAGKIIVFALPIRSITCRPIST